MGRIGSIAFVLSFVGWTLANPVITPTTPYKACPATNFMDPILKNCSHSSLLCSAVWDVQKGICLQKSKESAFLIPENSETFHKELTNLKNSSDKEFVKSFCRNVSTTLKGLSPLGNFSKLNEIFNDSFECQAYCYDRQSGVSDLCITLLWAKKLFDKPVPNVTTITDPQKLYPQSKSAKLGEPNISGKLTEPVVDPPNENSSSEKTNFSQLDKTAKKTQEKKEQGKTVPKATEAEVSKKLETEEKEDEQSQLKNDNIQDNEEPKQSNDNKENNDMFEDKDKDQDNEEGIDVQAGQTNHQFKFDGFPIESDAEDSHLLTYFSIFTLICIVFYIGLHNKQKILAIILEGRRGRRGRGIRRRPSTANYRKLDSNLEEAVTSQCSLNATQVIY